ncbi:hypothetical protein B0T14DRAFT_537644 [Immersiella caudata]|uniref:TauD/TfdA-like domain-containing protein n=1 Tax=Immersiella caudata TaxID=314043 RepID=A0AA39WR37_9PEZI|nr:hypothetical protein B0T14DRAFT_537644 [Immersiella caudata]
MSAKILRQVPYTPSVTFPPPYPEGTPFPLSLRPAANSSLVDITAEIRDLAASGKIRTLLDRHGTIYFQGLGLRDAHEFSEFVHAFRWKVREDIGNLVRRTVLAKKPVHPHNEFGLSPHHPAHPEFINEAEVKGIKYQLFHPHGSRHQTSSAGTTVLQAYGKHVLDSDDAEIARQKIEKEIRRLRTATWRWGEPIRGESFGGLACFPTSAVRNHPRTREPAFFNNAVSRFLNALDNKTLLPPHINEEGQYQPPVFRRFARSTGYLDTAVNYIYRAKSLVKWKESDVIVLDISNLSVQHAREPWTGNRKLLASLWDDE